MLDKEKNALELNIAKDTNARKSGDRLTQNVKDGVYIAFYTGSTYASIQERFKVSVNIVSKIKKQIKGYKASQAAKDYVNEFVKNKEKILDARTSFMYDGRLEKLQDTMLEFMTSPEYLQHIMMENPQLALKTLSELQKFVAKQQEIMIKRELIKTDTDAETVKAMTDFAKTIVGGSNNGNE